MKRFEDRIYTNLSLTEIELKNSIDQAPKFGGTGDPSDTYHMRNILESENNAYKLTKELDDEEVSKFRVKSMSRGVAMSTESFTNFTKLEAGYMPGINPPMINIIKRKRKVDKYVKLGSVDGIVKISKACLKKSSIVSNETISLSATVDVIVKDQPIAALPLYGYGDDDEVDDPS